MARSARSVWGRRTALAGRALAAGMLCTWTVWIGSGTLVSRPVAALPAGLGSPKWIGSRSMASASRGPRPTLSF
eukprot:7218384-Alexandrium_andersonii.AAC.1